MRQALRLSFALLVSGVGTACITTPAAPPEAGSSESTPTVGSGSALSNNDWALLAAAQSTPEVLATLPPPSFATSSLPPQTCSADSDCRTIQPADWSADVECCYEYGCGLEFVAVNQSSFGIWRAWKNANPFDCPTHLQANGPCENRPIRCGLLQDEPESACVMGTCQVIFPDTWPAADPQAQTCAVDNDCSVVNLDAASPQAQCCQESPCTGRWAALNERTRQEFSQLLAMQPAVSCDNVDCEPVQCTRPALVVTCETGICRLAE
jgi:hypothetical protein